MKRSILFIVLASLLLAGCGDTIQGKSVAEPEVATFHERLNKGEFGTIFTSASEDFRNAISREKAEALFSAIIRKLGQHQSSREINWSVKTFNMTTTVVLVYDSTYADGQATESFTFRIKDGKPELLGYNIGSLDMLIK